MYGQLVEKSRRLCKLKRTGSAGKKSSQPHVEARGHARGDGMDLNVGRTWGGGGLLILLVDIHKGRAAQRYCKLKKDWAHKAFTGVIWSFCRNPIGYVVHSPISF